MVKSTMTNSQIRKTFAKRRRKGDVTNLVNSFWGQYSQSHVSNVLAGRRNNSEILKGAYKIVARRKEVVA